AMRQVFGPRADDLVVGATKSLVGHTLGAAGAIGAVACALSLETGLVHPTLNCDDLDPACSLPGISAKVQQRRLEVGVVNAFGFGGNNACVVLRRADTPG